MYVLRERTRIFLTCTLPQTQAHTGSHTLRYLQQTQKNRRKEDKK